MKIADNLELIANVKNFIRLPVENGYPKILIMADGGILCGECSKSNYKRILNELREEADPEWLPVEVNVHWEGEPLTCAHCYAEIESAYGIPGEDY